jgi:hypothetical protein
MSLIEIGPRGRGRKLLVIRIFLEAVLGGLGLFVLAAIVAPRLFNLHSNLSLVAAVLVWIACPVLLFLLAGDIAARLRDLRSNS